jgi:hypothetical protein
MLGTTVAAAANDIQRQSALNTVQDRCENEFFRLDEINQPDLMLTLSRDDFCSRSEFSPEIVCYR